MCFRVLRTVVFKLKPELESRGGLVKTQMAGPSFWSLWSAHLGWRTSDAEAAGPGTRL